MFKSNPLGQGNYGPQIGMVSPIVQYCGIFPPRSNNTAPTYGKLHLLNEGKPKITSVVLPFCFKFWCQHVSLHCFSMSPHLRRRRSRWFECHGDVCSTEGLHSPPDPTIISRMQSGHQPVSYVHLYLHRRKLREPKLPCHPGPSWWFLKPERENNIQRSGHSRQL